MLNPAGVRHYLAMFKLVLANNFARMVKDHETST
jgi:hypothetical protein